jgi:hypothetical protein
MRHRALPILTAVALAAALAPAAGARPAPPDPPVAPVSSEQALVPAPGGGDSGLDAGWIVAICGGAAAAGAAAGFAGARMRHTAPRPS